MLPQAAHMQCAAGSCTATHAVMQTARARVTDIKQQVDQQQKRKCTLQEELANIKRVRCVVHMMGPAQPLPGALCLVRCAPQLPGFRL